MKYINTTVFIFLLLSSVAGQAEYPEFSKEYWQDQEESARGKITRGAALGVTGAILIWPTAVMISRAKDNPHKYVPLSILFGAASLGAMGHGFASVGYGKKQRSTASHWVDQYNSSGSPDVTEMQADYIHDQQKSALKMTLFGSYATSIATMMLTNGIIQSTRSEGDIAEDDISIWPYYAVGGALLPMGIMGIVNSRQRSSDLDELETNHSISARSQFTPFVTLSPQGDAVFGAYYSLRF